MTPAPLFEAVLFDCDGVLDSGITTCCAVPELAGLCQMSACASSRSSDERARIEPDGQLTED
jgi:hypothetical protein